MYTITVKEMKLLEESANSSGYSYMEMMQKAGLRIAQVIDRENSQVSEKIVIGLVGKGNNGGDTLVALAYLASLGWQSYALLVTEREKEDSLVEHFKSVGGEIITLDDIDSIKCEAGTRRIILDGVFGTGFRLPLPEGVREKLVKLDEKIQSDHIYAVDCPSGADCESGEVDSATLHADVTICLEAVKSGLLKFPAFEYCGRVMAVDLGLRKYLAAGSGEDQVIDHEFVLKHLPKRPLNSHKGTFGKVLVIGGSINYTGAPILAGKGAYSVGAGLVQLGVPECVYQTGAASGLELTWLILDDSNGVIADIAIDTLLPHLEGVNCIILGPGLGREETTKRFLHRLISNEGISHRTTGAGFVSSQKTEGQNSSKQLPPFVIDADALTLACEDEESYSSLQVKGVLTPHPGEMARMTGLPVDEIQANRLQVAREYAMRWKQTLVLKGAVTVIATENGQAAYIPIASTSLAKAGTGDVLSGMIGGLIAQGCSPFEAACCGAWLHGQAGLMASKRIGSHISVMATDIIKAIPSVFPKSSK